MLTKSTPAFKGWRPRRDCTNQAISKGLACLPGEIHPTLSCGSPSGLSNHFTRPGSTLAVFHYPDGSRVVSPSDDPGGARGEM